ncbi:methionine adenosyltransferase [candidate division WOR-3 bacterium]|nr:methionine adenosyltransferase [candidate division WOR-3 bacterium]
MEKYLFTSESVTEGHPDKLCDQISDAILDGVLTKDHDGRVACETLTTTGLIMIVGEITTSAYVEFQQIARKVVMEAGYDDPKYGFDYESCAVMSSIHNQTQDIATGVDTGGAGDQGMMFGFACKETKELMPLPIMLAHKLTRRLAEVRKTTKGCRVWPDGKSQVTVEYNKERKPVRIDTVVVSTQHSADFKKAELDDFIRNEVIFKTLPMEMIDNDMKIFINPTGKFVNGGPAADSGLTGRKIMVDTYGGYARHGGGAFSGKDPTKVDRSGAYMARYLAKNVVAAGLAEKCEIQIAYAIGIARPVSVFIETFGTGKTPDEEIAKKIQEIVDLTPQGIIQRFKLTRPIYRNTSVYGHFGRENEGFPWEVIDLVKDLK